MNYEEESNLETSGRTPRRAAGVQNNASENSSQEQVTYPRPNSGAARTQGQTVNRQQARRQRQPQRRADVQRQAEGQVQEQQQRSTQTHPAERRQTSSQRYQAQRQGRPQPQQAPQQQSKAEALPKTIKLDEWQSGRQTAFADATPDAGYSTKKAEKGKHANNLRDKLPLKPIIAVLVAIIAIAAILFVVAGVRVIMNGDAEVTLTNKEAYTEQGAEACFFCIFQGDKTMPLEVDTKSNVNADKPGNYTVTYSAHNLLWFGQATRRVNVVDTAAPVITLEPQKKADAIAGKPFEDPGFSATDDYDGDVTAKVSKKESDGKIYYTVSDSSGNKAEAVRTILYYDPTPPSIELNGDENFELSAGSEFVDPWVVATDNIDGDISDKVTTATDLDTNVEGRYTITYSVEDSSGNVATTTRTVIVIPPGHKVVYLTFDDGPGPHTRTLLDILDKHGAKATFFVTAHDDVSLIREEFNRGHAIGVHSLTHNYKEIYSSEEAYFNDLNAMNDIIEGQTGHRTSLIRFPGGSSNTVSDFNKGIMSRLVVAVTQRGFQYFDWNVGSGDAGNITETDVIFENIVNGIKANDVSVVLQHDTKDFSVAAVDKVLEWGKKHGYTFKALTPGSPTAHHGVNN